MKTENLLKELQDVSDWFFQKKDYINAGRINVAMDAIRENYLKNVELPEPTKPQ